MINIIIFGFFVFVLAFRLSLIDRGQFLFPDEFRDNHAVTAWVSCIRKDFHGVLNGVFRAQARPGFIIISLIPTAIKFFLVDKGLLIPHSVHLPCVSSVFNVIISLMILYVFYRLLLALFKDRGLALTGCVVYSLLCNSNLYLRHLFPYDMSLIFFLLALYLFIRGKDLKKTGIVVYVFCGILSAFTFATYPGYYVVFPFFLIIFLLLNPKQIWGILSYLLSAAAVIGILEYLSLIIDFSYLRDCQSLSRGINQGTFSESLVFMIKYLVQVEGLIGGVLLISFFVYMGLRIKNKPLEFGPVKSVVIAGLILYLYYGYTGVFLKKMVFYGRLIHFYVPMLVIALVAVIKEIPAVRIRKYVVIGTLVISSISFCLFYKSYSQVSYPRDFILQNIRGCPREKITRLDETGKEWETGPNHNFMMLINTNMISPIKEKFVEINSHETMVFKTSAPHPLNFEAYLFEGFSIEERMRMKTRKYKMKMFIDPRIDRWLKGN